MGGRRWGGDGTVGWRWEGEEGGGGLDRMEIEGDV